MFGIAWGALKAVVAFLNVFGLIGRWLERRRAVREGRIAQRLESLEATKEQASDARRIDENVAGMSDATLDEQLRKRARKRK